MKLVRDRTDAPAPQQAPAAPPPQAAGPRYTWKLLVVDDDPDIRAVTRLNLKGFRFAERELEIVEAESAYQARKILQEQHDIAVALVDVVMETDDAGLRLVEYIRHELRNEMIRLVIRTGQPGAAPERFVIDHFDIDDYKDKTELTATRLYTTVRSALKAYRDLHTIELNRRGLARLLEAVPDLYRLTDSPDSLNQFFEGVLTQIIGLCNLAETSLISTIDGVVATFDGKEIKIQAATGEIAHSPRLEQIRTECTEVVLRQGLPCALRKNAFVIPLSVTGHAAGFIYIEPTRELSESDLHLLGVFAQQCSGAMDNLRLHMDLQQSYDNVIDTLAEVAEYKDKTTGDHINRIDHYTRKVAMELGIPEAEARMWGKASRLHDVGKVGIPDALLRKPGKLTAEEYEVVRGHTRIGGSILGHDKLMTLAREIAEHHHERWDGDGYPSARPEREFSLATRIVSVVDVFDALVSPRPYKEAWPKERAAEEIRKGAGSQFDPTAVEAFMALLGRGELDEYIASAQTIPTEAAAHPDAPPQTSPPRS
jgi:response regulator RpfG family c-di-GMP phosphodiesterase